MNNLKKAQISLLVIALNFFFVFSSQADKNFLTSCFSLFKDRAGINKDSNEKTFLDRVADKVLFRDSRDEKESIVESVIKLDEKYEYRGRLMKDLIKEGENINKKIKGKTPLDIAIENGNTEMAKVLISLGANVRKAMAELLRAIENGNQKAVERLIRLGLDVNRKIEGKTLLLRVIEKGDKEMLGLLISLGVKVNQNKISNKGRLEFLRAVENGDKEKVDLLISLGFDVNGKIKGETPLSVAVKKYNKEMAELLMSRGAKVNKNEKGYKKMVESLIALGVVDVNKEENLYKAIIVGDREQVDFLIKLGGDLYKNVNGKMSLSLVFRAFNESDVEMIDLVSALGVLSKEILQGVDKWKVIDFIGEPEEAMRAAQQELINVREVEDSVVISRKLMVWYALHSENGNVLHKLINEGVNVVDLRNESVYYYYTALMDASRQGYLRFVQELIKQGSDVNFKDRYGKTALMYAEENGQRAVADELIKSGADVNFEDRYGKTALMYAEENGQRAVADELIKSGADVNFKDENGKTALDVDLTDTSSGMSSGMSGD